MSNTVVTAPYPHPVAADVMRLGHGVALGGWEPFDPAVHPYDLGAGVADALNLCAVKGEIDVDGQRWAWRRR